VPTVGELVERGASWRFLADGSDQGTAWRSASFDDSTWAQGAAELGYGDGGEATVLGYGPDPSHKYKTTYFRRRFTVSDPGALSSLSLGVRRDDGAAVYLNGVEVARSNLPSGELTYLTDALTWDVSETEFADFDVPASRLVQGTNVLAVEIHQHGWASSDLSFDLELVGARGTPPSSTTTTVPTSTTVPATTTSSTTTTTTTTTTVPSGGSSVVVGASSTTAYSVPSGALFVATSGSDSNPGTQAAPFATLSKALSTVSSGGTVVVRGGTYHQSAATSRTTKVMAYPGEHVVFDGARAVTNFSVHAPGVWVATGWSFEPARMDHGSSSLITSSAPYAGWPEQTFYDGNRLNEVGSLAEIGPGKFYVDRATDKLYLGSDPTGHLVEASDLEVGFTANGHTGSELRGIHFRRYATPVASIGAVRAWSNNMIVENVAATDSAYAGITAIGENITIINSTMSNNGALGGHAHKANNLRWARNIADHNNTQNFNVSWEAGGFKMTKSRYITIEDNWIHSNYGNGYWLDQSAQDITLRRNTIVDNTRSGVMLELSGRLNVHGNLIARNARYGLYSNDSNDIAAWNNIIVDNSTDIHLLDDATRSTSDTSSSDHDNRYPIPNPNVLWETRNITIKNNVVGDHSSTENWSTPALIAYDDNGNTLSYTTRSIAVDNNAYWQRPNGTSTKFSRLDVSSRSQVVTSSLSEHKALTGLDAASVGSTSSANPFVSSSGLTLRSTTSSGGTPMPSTVAAQLSVPNGSSAIGIPTAVASPTPAR
jgi:parallel beta-helix repeat protein